MAVKKSSKKTKKQIGRSQKNITARSKQSQTTSFIIGVITVAIIALLIFQFAQGNNYRTVLGEQTSQYSK